MKRDKIIVLDVSIFTSSRGRWESKRILNTTVENSGDLI
jgi:hypothetical protein